MQTSKKPFSPFFCYQQYVIDELANQNPNLKPSELTALIANKWNSLPPESRSKYEIMYKEAVEIENAKIEQSGVAISPKEELEVSRRKTEDDEGVFGTKIKTKKGAGICPKSSWFNYILVKSLQAQINQAWTAQMKDYILP